jgi:hypothetical protein
MMEYWNTGKQWLPWSNLAARAAWNNSGILGKAATSFSRYATPSFQYSIIPLFQEKP